MKITLKQYQEAQAKIHKLKKAEEIVKAWEKAVEGENREVTSVNITQEGTELTYRKGVKDAERIPA